MKKKSCVFTFLYDEPVIFKIWLDYYSRFFSSTDIYVLHAIKKNRTDFDEWLADQNGFIRIEVPEGPDYDFIFITEKVKSFKNTLLEEYEYVIYCDVDEMVCSPIGLENYINECTQDYIYCFGYEVVHKYINNEELDFDPSKSIFSQRNWWYHSRLYSKPLLSKINLNYCPGFHHITDRPCYGYDQNLLLIHLHKLDFKIALARILSRIQVEGNHGTLPGAGTQNSLSEAGLHHFWFKNLDDGSLSTPSQLVEIPQYVKDLIPL